MSIDGNYCAMCKKLITDCTCPVIVNRVDLGECGKLKAKIAELKEDLMIEKALKNALFTEGQKLKEQYEQTNNWLIEAQTEVHKLKELVREAIKEWGRIDIYKTWGRKAKQLIGDKSGGTDGS